LQSGQLSVNERRVCRGYLRRQQPKRRKDARSISGEICASPEKKQERGWTKVQDKNKEIKEGGIVASQVKKMRRWDEREEERKRVKS
jgi:hypothetical protein